MLTVSLCLVGYLCYLAQVSVDERAQAELESYADDLQTAIQERMSIYNHSLSAGNGFLLGSESVSRDEWHAFVEQLKVSETYPGIQGLGYAQVIQPEDLAEHERFVRSQGFPNYRVRPEGVRDLYTSIIYLEPFSGRNLKAFGYDMFSESTRRIAMELARDSGDIAMSASVILVQEGDQDVPRGFLVYSPDYERIEDDGGFLRLPLTVEERRAHLRGFVYTVFRVGDFMAGLNFRPNLNLAYQLSDETPNVGSAKMYESSKRVHSFEDASATSEHQASRSFVFPGGSTWRLDLCSEAGFVSNVEKERVSVILAAGIVTSFLLFFIIRLLVSREARAQRIAQQMTQELSELNDRFMIASESAGLGVWDLNVESGKLDWNRQMFTLYGIDPQGDFIPSVDAWLNCIHPEDVALAVSEYESAMADSANFNSCFRVLRRNDGAIKHIQAYSKIYRSDSGKILRVVGVNLDVTQSVEDQAAIHASEEKFRSFFELSPIGIVLSSYPDGRFLEANPAMIEPTGYDIAELRKLSGRDITPAEYEARDLELMDELAARGRYGPYEKEYIRKDGTRFPVLLNCVLFEDSDGHKTLLSLVRDITHRKAQEQELKSLDADLNWYNNALNSISVVVVTDVEGTILTVNDKFCESTGFTRDELIGHTHRLINSGYHSKEFYQEMYTAIQSGQVWRGELCNKKKSGELYWDDTSIVPEMNAQGQPTRYIAFRIDITQRKRLEGELKESRANAERANRAKSAFLATMSHEIRTPMNAVVGMTLLLWESPLSEQQADYVNTIRTSGDNLLNIINDILDFSKIESEEVVMEQIPFNLYDSIIEPIGMLTVKANGHRIELAYEIDPHTPLMVVGDPTRLGQVLLNVLSNALKFTPEGGEVSLVVRSEKQAEGGWKLLFDINDNGIGMSEEVLGGVFQPFKQADDTVTRKYGGTGLGLAISRRLARLMGGDLVAFSRKGTGSKFTFDILVGEDAASPCVFEQEDPAQFSNRSIVLLDRRPENLHLFAAMAGGLGIEVSAFSRAEDVLALSDFPEPDAIVTDFEMHRGACVEFARGIREKLGWKSPILISSSIPLELSSFPTGLFFGVLVKPLRFSLFRRVMMRLLSNKKDAFVVARKELVEKKQHFDGKLAARFPLNLLVVEDNVINLKVISHILAKMGYSHESAVNGVEAVKMAKQANYDLILMDLEMPEMGGVEATIQILEHATEPNIPYISALSANVFTDQKRACHRVGMKSYLTKPIVIGALEQVLEQAYDCKSKEAAPSRKIKQLEATAQPARLDAKVVTEAILVDYDYLESTLGMALEPGCLDSIMDGAIEAIRNDLNALQDAVRAQDGEAGLKILHVLKGVFGNLGMLRLAQRVGAHHSNLKELGQIPTAEAISSLFELFDEALEALDALKSGKYLSE